MTDRQCDCAERTGELIVFTCPVCCGEALLRGPLTERVKLLKLDRPGSVSGTLELEEPLGKY